MVDIRAKAPTLAWLLTALACLLAGMAIVESRHQAVALPISAPSGVTETVADADPTPEPTPIPDLGPVERPAPPPTLLVGDVVVSLSAGPASLRVERLTVPPGVDLAPEAAPGPTVLLVEAGALAVRTGGAAYVGQPFGVGPTDTVLRPGERLAVAAGEGYAVRNDGTTPAVALAVVIEPVAATPDHWRWLPVG